MTSPTIEVSAHPSGSVELRREALRARCPEGIRVVLALQPASESELMASLADCGVAAEAIARHGAAIPLEHPLRWHPEQPLLAADRCRVARLIAAHHRSYARVGRALAVARGAVGPGLVEGEVALVQMSTVRRPFPRPGHDAVAALELISATAGPLPGRPATDLHNIAELAFFCPADGEGLSLGDSPCRRDQVGLFASRLSPHLCPSVRLQIFGGPAARRDPLQPQRLSYAELLAEELARRGHEVHLFAHCVGSHLFDNASGVHLSAAPPSAPRGPVLLRRRSNAELVFDEAFVTEEIERQGELLGHPPDLAPAIRAAGAAYVGLGRSFQGPFGAWFDEDLHGPGTHEPVRQSGWPTCLFDQFMVHIALDPEVAVAALRRRWQADPTVMDRVEAALGQALERRAA